MHAKIQHVNSIEYKYSQVEICSKNNFCTVRGTNR